MSFFRSKLVTVGSFILIVELMERLTYYTFAGSERNNLERQFGYSTAEAVAIRSVFGVLSYVTGFFGAFIADTLLGRFKTIAVFIACYCIGVTMCSTAVHPNVLSAPAYLAGIMFFMALGAGGMKPNISNFGGDQYDPKIPKEKKEQELFFSLFYAAVNAGSAVSYGCLTTIATGGTAALPGQAGNNLIPKEYGYFAAYIFAAICIFIAMVVFIAGSSRYNKIPPSGNSFGGALYFLWNGAKNTTRGKMALSGWCCLLVFLVVSITNAFLTSKPPALPYVSLALALIGCISVVLGHVNNDWLRTVPDHPKDWLKTNEAVNLFSIVPVVLTTNICFMLTYNMMDGPIPVQTCHMNLKLGGGQVNGTFIHLINPLTIVIGIPILNFLVWPMFERCRRVPTSRYFKLMFGFGFAFLSMLFATIFEFVRRGTETLPEVEENISLCAGNKADPVYMKNISAFAMFLPLAMTALAEICINPTLLYMSYSQAPPRTRSLAQAFNLFCAGAMPNGFLATITKLLAKYMPDNLDTSPSAIEYFYYAGFIACALGVGLVTLFSRMYVEKQYVEDMEDEKQVETFSGTACTVAGDSMMKDKQDML